MLNLSAAPVGVSLKSAVQDALELAIKVHGAGQLDMACELYRKIVQVDPNNSIAWHHLGVISFEKGDLAIAVEFVARAVSISPADVRAHSNLAAIFRAAGRLSDAALSAEHAVALDPSFAAGFVNLGAIRTDQNEFDQAIDAYEEACKLDPMLVEAHVNLADLLCRLNHFDEAISVCMSIIERQCDAAAPYVSAGKILIELECADEAIGMFQRALQIRPDFVQAHYNLGTAFRMANRFEEAKASYRRALAFDPSLIVMDVHLHFERRRNCDWDGLEAAELKLIEKVAECDARVPPFPFFSFPDASNNLLLDIARRYAREIPVGTVFEHRFRSQDGSRKIKIGYLSADFHSHATALLIADLFERHDRNSFEVFGYSYGVDDGSQIRRRISRAFDSFIDVREGRSLDVADRIFSDEIDILVDLKGFTKLARPEILNHRPAPIQVSYLGYPGTTGLKALDYIIGDPVVTPLDHQEFYDEKIVQLPDCYQVNDPNHKIAEAGPSKHDCGLPDDAFVFCNFNDSYKLSPRLFSIWMRLLKAKDGSVLWILGDTDEIKSNLRNEAQKCGIDASRIVFASRIDNADHLARHKHADLFLDCFPYNAHTTASDAIWAGLPLLTLMGNTFPSRVAASILYTLGTPELVAKSEADYEEMGLRLATDSDLLFGLRNRLQMMRLTSPLFDAERMVKHIEAAYTRMFEIWISGEKPVPFSIHSI